MNKYNEGVEPVYVDPPVPVNYLYWKRGNAGLSSLRDSDPGAFFGGWTASVKGKDEDLPALPIPVVTRVSDDGKNTYERYASNVINFLPIASRMRYEKREKGIDKKTQREVEKITAVSKNYISGVHVGFQPHKQVFGILFSDDMKTYAYAILKLNKWSSFLSFSQAAQVWSKVKVADDHALVRRYGSVGVEVENNTKKSIMPNFEVFGEGRSTPIEAVRTDNPLFVPITPEMDKIWEQAQEWARCQKWNASGEVVDETEKNQLPPMPEDFPFGDPTQD